MGNLFDEAKQRRRHLTYIDIIDLSAGASRTVYCKNCNSSNNRILLFFFFGFTARDYRVRTVRMVLLKTINWKMVFSPLLISMLL